jgi:hypothetical protein
MRELVTAVVIAVLFGFALGIGVSGGIEELIEKEPRIAGQVVPGEVSCFEDELIGFVARDTIACIHVDDVVRGEQTR